MKPSSTVSFLKMQGLGNDFIVIDDFSRFQNRAGIMTPEFARQICDRRFGVGADQILWLRRPENPSADCRMEILNSDGSTAEMCGNGIRAVGIYLHDYGPRPKHLQYSVETLAGMKAILIRGRQVAVDMGPPGLGPEFSKSGEELTVDGQTLRFFEVSMGNPHAVFFVDDLNTFPVEKLGPLIENHPRFPKRTNVEFVQLTGPSSIQVRVWERGAGITLACGTGACASAVASLGTKKVSGELDVRLPGGALKITWPGPGESVIMEGPAQEVFRGEYQP